MRANLLVMKVQKTIDYVLNLNREQKDIQVFRSKTLNYCAIMKMRVIPGLFLPMEGIEYILPNNPDFKKKAETCVLTGFTYIEHKNELQHVICVMLGDVELMTIHPGNEERDLIIYQNSRFKTTEDLAGLARFTDFAIKLYYI